MPSGAVKVIGMQGVRANFYGTKREVARAVRAVNDRSSMRVYRAAESRVPVRSGRMRRSLRRQLSKEGLTYTVFYDPAVFAAEGVDFYPIYVELGTSKMAAQPTLGPAFEEEAMIYTAQMGAAIRAALRAA